MPIRGHAQIINKITLINKMLLLTNLKECEMWIFKILDIIRICDFCQLFSLDTHLKLQEYGCI